MTDDRRPQLVLPARRGIGYANWVGEFRSWGALKGASSLIVVGAAGAQRTSWAKISQIRTLSTQRLGGKVGEATAREVATVLEGLNEILGA